MSSITPLSAEAIAQKLENEYQNVALAALTALVGAAGGVLAAHGPAVGAPTVVLALISGLLMLASVVLGHRYITNAREFLLLPRSVEIDIQDNVARQSPEVREYLETAQRMRGGLVAHDLPFIEEIAARKPSQVRPMVA